MLRLLLNRINKNKVTLSDRKTKYLKKIWKILWSCNWDEKEQLKVLSRLLPKTINPIIYVVSGHGFIFGMFTSKRMAKHCASMVSHWSKSYGKPTLFPCVYETELNKNLWQILENKHFGVKPQPLGKISY